MRANSRPVTSSQTTIHDHLAALVAKHAATDFRKPVMTYNQAAFDGSLAAWHAAGAMPLILDTGCGVGLSTMHLAAQFPDHFVIGVDQSAHRLSRNTSWEGEPPANCIRVRADLVDFWRLMAAAGIRLARHYMLYPNPWPKIGQVQRRWPAHPVFPAAVSLGGVFECRSNWRIYVEECAQALTQLGAGAVQCAAYVPERTITPFEQKYLESGHTLWRCVAQLG